MAKMTITLENGNVETFALEDLFIAKNQLQVIDAGYQELKLAAPEWVTDRLGEISHEITSRVRAELQRKLKAAKARRSGLMTADEKRKMLDDEINELEAKLQ